MSSDSGFATMNIDVVKLTVIIIIIVLFYEEIKAALYTIKFKITDLFSSGEKDVVETEIEDDSAPEVPTENMTDKPESSDVLTELGYDTDFSWEDAIKADNIDPSVHSNHREFVKDSSRFSSGVGFSALDDESRSRAAMNFQGFRRPQHVPIGATARQQPDVDETVLQRHKEFRF